MSNFLEYSENSFHNRIIPLFRFGADTIFIKN